MATNPDGALRGGILETMLAVLTLVAFAHMYICIRRLMGGNNGIDAAVDTKDVFASSQHRYCSNSARDNSRVHYGNVYHFHPNLSSKLQMESNSRYAGPAEFEQNSPPETIPFPLDSLALAFIKLVRQTPHDALEETRDLPLDLWSRTDSELARLLATSCLCVFLHALERRRDSEA